jgi:transcription elongation factor SPT4
LEQFENDGCDNCEPFLNLRNHRENVYDCTSSSFDGSVILKRK